MGVCSMCSMTQELTSGNSKVSLPLGFKADIAFILVYFEFSYDKKNALHIEKQYYYEECYYLQTFF